MHNDLNAYKEFIDLYTDAVVIIQDNRIVLYNKSAEKLIPSIQLKSLESILKTFQPLASQRMSEMKKKKRSLGSLVYPIHISDDKMVWLELTSNYIEINGRPATLTVAKPAKSDEVSMSEASMLQRHLALSQNWVQNGCYIKPLHYVTTSRPKSFYFTLSIEEHHFGWVGELEDDLILSSVFIIAMEQYFQRVINSYEWQSESTSLLEMTEKLIDRVDQALEIKSLSYQIWHLDSCKGILHLINHGGSGVMCTSDDEIVNLLDESYDEDELMKIPIETLKWLSLGNIEFNLDFVERYKTDVFRLAEELSNQLYISGVEKQRDQCSVFMDFTFQGTFYEEIFHGVMEAQNRIDVMLEKLPTEVDPFSFRLVFMELLTNAYKHGSDLDDKVPIKVIVYVNSKELYIEIFDLQSRRERIKVKHALPLESILEESGRGLFLVNNFVDTLYLTGNSVIAKITNRVV